MTPLLVLLFVALARADSPEAGSPASPAPAAPAPVFGVALEPPEEQVRFRERRAAAGVSGPAAELSCSPFAESVALCLTVAVDDGYRYVTRADLEAWAFTVEQALAAARARAQASVGPARPERVSVVDMAYTYRMSAEGDGLDHAAFLAPDALVAALGAEVRVAAPTRDVLLAWAAEGEELDRVMAVGVARISEAGEHPVTSKVYTWDPVAAGWVVWGQATR